MIKLKEKTISWMLIMQTRMRITCFPFSFARWTPATTKPCLTTYRITKELSELIDSKPRSDRINKFGEKKLCLELKTKR